MPHLTISFVENEENGVEKPFSITIFFSRLNEKVDKILLCFLHYSTKTVIFANESIKNVIMIMPKVYVFLADGFEDIEALAPIDILRRGGVDVTTVSIMDTEAVQSAHGVIVLADVTFAEAGDFADADLLMLPGGMPGASNLDAHAGVRQALVNQAANGGLVAAICAAPFVLGKLGLLRGRRATCYPGFEQYLDGAEYTAELLTEDGNVITGEGPGAAFDFGYALLGRLASADVVEALKEGMRYNHLMQG